MPRFEPFRALRYSTGALVARGQRHDDVIAPPYDVIDAGERQRLATRSTYNSVHVELPEPGPAGEDRYLHAARLLATWRREQMLTLDTRPALYPYRMVFEDPRGRSRHTTGVIGAMEVAVPGDGDVLPHERTLPKAKSDRFDLLRACRTNLSPVWGLSLAPGLTARIPLDDPPAVTAVDDERVQHQLWVLDDPDAVSAISALVARAPVVIADGHHRYETALAYNAEEGARPGALEAPSLVMTLVVELSEQELTVSPIHRVLGHLGGDPLSVLEPFFMVERWEGDPSALSTTAASRGALGIVTRTATALLVPKPSTVEAAGDDLDSSYLDVALSHLPDHEVTYEASLPAALERLATGDAQAVVLPRPATVAQIADCARARRRMPPKTTFFHPKPRTGMLFRPLVV